MRPVPPSAASRRASSTASARRGAALLLGQWGQLYSDPGVQAGPFELLPYGLAALLGVEGVLGWAIFFLVFGYVLLVALVFTVLLPQGVAAGRAPLYITLAIGAVAVLGGFLPAAIASGHPSQLVIPLLWVVAGCLARRDRFVAAGVVLGLSTGWEVWGVLGAPVVLLAARPGLVRAALGGLAAVAAIYLPFVLVAPFLMFEKSWAVDGGSLVHLIWPDLIIFPWTLRLAQTLLALIAGCAVALLTRRSDLGLWLVPLAVVSTRLVLDPLVFGYYWIAPVTIALGLAGMLALRRHWWGVAAAALIPLLALVPGGRAPWAAVAVLAGCLAAGILIAVRTRAAPAVP